MGSQLVLIGLILNLAYVLQKADYRC